MTFFTVYHGNNESTVFNAECTVGSLVNRMMEVLQPPNPPGYTRLELLPFSFVSEHFSPPTSGTSHATLTRQGSICLEPSISIPNTKTPPFNGPIPLIGLATRPLESYADSLLCATSANPSNSNNTTTGNTSAFGAANATGILSATGSNTPGAVASMQHCYVLLGCRHGFPQPALSTPPACTNTGAGKGKISVDPAVMAQRTASLQHARELALCTIAGIALPPPGLGSGGKAANLPAPAQSGNGTPPIQTATLLAAQNNVPTGIDLTASWRHALGTFLTPLLMQSPNPTAEGTMSGMSPLPPEERECPSPTFTSCGETSTNPMLGKAELLQAAATGLFTQPTTPMTGYDVLWRGPRGEHIRLQNALEDRMTHDTEPKKRRGKRG